MRDAGVGADEADGRRTPDPFEDGSALDTRPHAGIPTSPAELGQIPLAPPGAVQAAQDIVRVAHHASQMASGQLAEELVE